MRLRRDHSGSLILTTHAAEPTAEADRGRGTHAERAGARRRLQQHEDYEELLLLAACDKRGRQRGVEAADLEEAIAYLRDLSAMCG